MKLHRNYWLGAAALAALAVAGTADAARWVVRFDPNMVSTQKLDGNVLSLADLTVRDLATRQSLESLDVQSLRPLCTYWWDVDAKEYYDRNGKPVEGLTSFEGVYVVETSDAIDIRTAQRIWSESPAVVQATPNGYGKFSADCGTPSVPSDDEFAQTTSRVGQWGMDNPGLYPGTVADVDVNGPEVLGLQGTSEVKIGILDSGIRTTHVDLAPNYDASLSMSTVDSGGPEDTFGHGTAVAGLAGADTNSPSDEGMASFGDGTSSYENIVMYRISLPGSGSWDASAAADAVSEAVDSEAIDVISMSIAKQALQGSDSSMSELWPLRDALRNAYKQGLTLIAAGGNPGAFQVKPIFPAAFERFCVAIGGIGPDEVHYGRTGYWIDLVAPATDLVSTCLDGSSNDSYCGGFIGTSGAAPLVAGISALIKTAVPTATNEDIEAVLRRTARDYGPAGRDDTWGEGLVRADEALAMIACDNLLEHYSASGSTTITLVDTRDDQDFRNTPGINAPTLFPGQEGNWRETYAEIYEIEKDVSWSGLGLSSAPEAWARGRECSTARDDDRYDYRYEAKWAELQDVTSTGGTLVGYAYKVWSDDTQSNFLGWYPLDPYNDDIDWEYSLARPVVTLTANGPKVDIESPRLWSVPEIAGGASLEFILPEEESVELSVFDVAGREIRQWNEVALGAGRHSVNWDGRAHGGERVPNGIYLVRMTTKQSAATAKVVIR